MSKGKNLEYYRNQIDEANEDLIILLKKRSRYKINNSLDNENPFLRAFYSCFLKDICKKGTNPKSLEKVASLDKKISECLDTRISYGEPIAKHKELYGLKIENKEREQEAIDKINKYAARKKFGKRDALEKAFLFIMKSTKDLQKIIINRTKLANNPSKNNYGAVTCSEKCIPILKEIAEERIGIMKGNYITKVVKGKYNNVPAWYVDIVRV